MTRNSVENMLETYEFTHFFGNILSFNTFWLYLAILISYMEITSKNILKMKV